MNTMAINYASKYAQKIDEKFARESMTSAAVNNDYDFVGVKTVNVYSVPTAEMNDYSVSGTSRYGTPQEIENTVQEMTMTRDRSFTFTIDRGTYNDTQMSNAAGAALQRQIREVVVPEIDKYRFGKICEGAKTTVTGKVTKANAYDAFLTGATTLIENNVPLVGSCAFVSSDFYKNIKEDSSFIRNGDMSQEILIKGQVGTIDGIPLIVVPKSYFPENEILDAVKLLLGIKDNDKDGVLMLLIEDTVNSVLAYCRIDVLPRQIVSFIPTLTVKRYTANQNGGVKSVTEGERKVEYSDDNYDYLKEYAIRLKPFVSRKVKVPSEVIADDKSV